MFFQWLVCSMFLQASASDLPYTSPIAGCKGFNCIEEYVKLPDDSYHWHDTGVRLSGVGSPWDEPGATPVRWMGYLLNMTSQTWRTPAKVNRPVWWHSLVVIVPENLETKDWVTLELAFGINNGTGLTRIDNYVTHGKGVWTQPAMSFNADDMEQGMGNLTAALQKMTHMATKTGAISAALFNLPNAYEIFGNDPSQFERNADILKGYTYSDFMVHPDEPERVDELPIAKAVVRAMDTIQSFTSTLPSGRAERFGVIGYSKLGGATWIAGALDDRIKAIAPMSMGMSQMTHLTNDPNAPLHKPSMKAQTQKLALETKPPDMYEPYAFYAWNEAAQTPAFKKFHNIFNAAAWMQRLNKPKLWAVSTTDHIVGHEGIQDHAAMYLPALPGSTTYLQLNGYHHDGVIIGALPTATAFFKGIMMGKSPPELDYSQSNFPILQTSVRLNDDISPTAVRYYTSREDGVAWESETVNKADGSWTGKASPMESVGNFMTLEFEWPAPGFRFTASTPAKRTNVMELRGPIVYRTLSGEMY